MKGLQEIALELELLGCADLAARLAPSEMLLLANCISSLEKTAAVGIFFTAYVQRMPDLKRITNIIDLDRQVVLSTSFPDDLRVKYWKIFPYWILQSRRLKDPVRKHPAGGVMLTRDEFYVLYKTARESLKNLKDLTRMSNPDVPKPGMWQRIFGPEISQDQQRERQISQFKRDYLVFEKFFNDLEKMWAKRGIETYMISWS